MENRLIGMRNILLLFTLFFLALQKCQSGESSREDIIKTYQPTFSNIFTEFTYQYNNANEHFAKFRKLLILNYENAKHVKTNVNETLHKSIDDLLKTQTGNITVKFCLSSALHRLGKGVSSKDSECLQNFYFTKVVHLINGLHDKKEQAKTAVSFCGQLFPVPLNIPFSECLNEKIATFSRLRYTYHNEIEATLTTTREEVSTCLRTQTEKTINDAIANVFNCKEDS